MLWLYVSHPALRCSFPGFKMHVTDVLRYSAKHHFYGGSGIVGEQVPLGAGLGFAHGYRKDGSVAVTIYGERLRLCYLLRGFVDDMAAFAST